LLKNEVCGSRE